MANRVYLFTREHGRCVQGETDVDALAAANVSIPLFWLSLFDRTSIITGIEHREPDESGEEEETDDEEYEYPYLVAPMDAALERSRSRWPAMAPVLGEQYAGLFNTWWDFVASHRAPFIHCETLEYCWLDDDPEALGDKFKSFLDAFSLPAWHQAGLLWKRTRLTPQWSELLGLAGIVEGDLRGQLPPNSLCGYEWSVPVPWPTVGRYD